MIGCARGKIREKGMVRFVIERKYKESRGCDKEIVSENGEGNKMMNSGISLSLSVSLFVVCSFFFFLYPMGGYSCNENFVFLVGKPILFLNETVTNAGGE